jgi:signal transduction histidine kinase
MFSSLRNRLSLFFISLAVLPVITVSGILAQRSFTTLEQEALDSQREIARGLGTEIDAFVREREHELTLVSEVNNLAALDPRDQRALLNSLLAHQQLYLEIALLDNAGQEQFRLSRFGVVSDADLVSRADRDEFLVPVSQGTAYYSPIYLGEAEREPLITIAVPVFDPFSEDVNSVLVADFRFRTIWDLIASMEFSSDEDLYVLNTEGTVIAHSDPVVVFEETHIDLPAQDGRAAGLSGNEVIFARDTLQFGDEQLIVVAEQLVSKALALANNVITVAAVVTALALLIAVILVILTVRRVVRPIERLSAVARSIQQGDLSQRADVTSEDEIGELARAFNDMTQQLDSFIGTLEERVAARTRDLQLAADVSKQINTLLSLDELLKQVVTLTGRSFNFYSTVIYLLSERENKLVRVTGADLKGEPLAATDRQNIPLDTKPSLIAEAARTRKAVVVNDVTKSPLYLPQSSRPATRAELAIPLLTKNELLGVFDLQSEKVDRFSPEDIAVLTTLAEQIAIAVRNANLFAEAQAARRVAEEANQVKSKFMANMSHELRTPLNSILNFAELVADGDLGGVNESQIEALNEVVGNGTHLLSLINDILDVTKIEVGMMELFVQDVNINELIDSVMATARVLVKDKPQVQIVTDVEPNLPTIAGDRRRIRQILLNLIANAVKFTSQGSISITAKRQDGQIYFAVRDTGVGIAPEDQLEIFDSFRQAQPGLLASTGAGLGLAISKHLAELHGGTIWLESELGKGSTFHVTLQARQPETSV